jgi:hypothetical protein
MAWQLGIRHGMAAFNPPYHQQLGRPVGNPPYPLRGPPWFAGMRLRHWYTRLVYPQQCCYRRGILVVLGAQGVLQGNAFDAALLETMQQLGRMSK